jgi:hypothetical protein
MEGGPESGVPPMGSAGIPGKNSAEDEAEEAALPWPRAWPGRDTAAIASTQSGSKPTLGIVGQRSGAVGGRTSIGGKSVDKGLNNDLDNAGKRGPADFNWVAERAACSLPRVFETMRRQVEGDIEMRNGLRPPNSPYQFSLVAKGSDFVAVLDADKIQSSVTFSLAERSIRVRDDTGTLIFEITVLFNDEGVCRLKVNGEEREFWQVRRMALENLMFPGNQASTAKR